MSPDPVTPYPELVARSDALFDACEDDVECITLHLDKLEEGIRSELLVSDLFNAWQAFYYYFRIVPDILIVERLELEPASSLVRGVKIDEIELLDIFFSVKEKKALITIGDGDKILATFSGKSAYVNGINYIENYS
jgi:hypothetical protein